MLNLSIFTDFCSLWWAWWILPFLLGLLLGWARWAKWRKMYDQLMSDHNSLKATLKKTEDDLGACLKKRASLDSEISMLNGQLKERDAKILQLRADLEACRSAKAAAPKVAATPPQAPKVENVASSIAATPTPPAAPKAASNKYAKLKEDNMQIIEGIGPKMESVLHENGIKSWNVLAGKSHADLKGMLDKYGDKYRIIDPNEWPAQAALADKQDWEGLIAYQKSDGSDSKAEKVMVKLGIIKAWKENDLKAVEGIGPKIEGLLNNGGITTWRGLAQTSVGKLKEILAAAGDRYQLADPTTWPKQAELAADGKWDELEEYQDFLQGGKNPG